MRDFTLKIDKLPDSFRQHKDPLSLKFAIWKQIQGKIEVAKRAGKCSDDIDPSIVEINLLMADNHLV